ncbi:MAG: hypothetical protein DMF77_13605 [Acidobacteria bacterium]|nr:MAG: hypothetical protein DMF77_13605 [Acidobacteriota bacterium]
MRLIRWAGPQAAVLGIFCLAEPVAAQTASPPPPKYPALPSETPATLAPATSGFDYVRRDVMIPMRDGVKLHTVVLVPRGAKGAAILLTRTPYDANVLTGHAQSAHLGPILSGYDNATDLMYDSEGDYVMNRPLRGPLNPTPVDHATDTYDTIDWLVKNVPETNGRVGILGISYDGFLPLMALVDPHPALKVAVPMNPMVDGWMGDDWFHNGAFRQQGMPYIYEQEATRKNEARWPTSHFDNYDQYLQAGSAGELGRRRGIEQVGFWRKILEHPSYDAFWRDQAVDTPVIALFGPADPAMTGPFGTGETGGPGHRVVRVESRHPSMEDITVEHVLEAARASLGAATPRNTSAGRSFARSWISTSRRERPRPTSRPSPRSRRVPTRGIACRPGRRAARAAAPSGPLPCISPPA